MRHYLKLSRRRAETAFSAALLLSLLVPGGGAMAVAGITRDFFQNADMTDANNYLPAGLGGDVRLTTPVTALIGGVTLDSLSHTNELNYTVGGLSFSGMSTGGAGIYVTGENSSLTAGLSFEVPPMTFDVAQPGGTLNISGNMNIGGQFGGTVAKMGRGTMNLRGLVTARSGGFSVNGGTLNVLEGGFDGRAGLRVNNLNAGAGTAVTANLFTSQMIRGLWGSVATPSSGTNTATINLLGEGNLLTIFFPSGPPGVFSGTYEGSIAGAGSLRLEAGTLTLAGAQSYSGTTTITGGSLLNVDGSTTGQGNYLAQLGSIGGYGTIGLRADQTITAGRLMPGRVGAIGTLTVAASGTGGVSRIGYNVDVAGAGSSDRLVIQGGAIDLTSGSSLGLTSLAGAFDGSDYTIATFSQNVNGGRFSSVQGLPAGYRVQYNPTSIKLVVIPPEPWALNGLKNHGSAGVLSSFMPFDNALEARPGGPNGEHTLQISFTNGNIVSGNVAIQSGPGAITGVRFVSSSIVVDLAGVPNASTVRIAFTDVTNVAGGVLPSLIVPISFLVGDATRNGTVNASDVTATKANSGEPLGAFNSHLDVNLSGAINASDVGFVKTVVGTGLPPTARESK
jgi:autotransporter-associated beta strand protein